MARTLDLTVSENDTTWLLQEAARRGGVFVGRDATGPDIQPIRIPPMARPAELYIVRGEDLDQLRRDHFEAEGVWRLDRVGAPVVQFVTATAGHKHGAPGWLQHEVGYFEQGQWTSFSNDFLDWTSSLYRLIKRRFARDPETGRYVGPTVGRLT